MTGKPDMIPEYKEVDERGYGAFRRSYPRTLHENVLRFFDPSRVCLHDFTVGKDWGSVVGFEIASRGMPIWDNEPSKFFIVKDWHDCFHYQEQYEIRHTWRSKTCRGGARYKNGYTLFEGLCADCPMFQRDLCGETMPPYKEESVR